MLISAGNRITPIHYAWNATDIAYAVTKLAQFAANPSEEHLNRALYICRYLLGTADYALIYDGKSDGGLIAYADSDWASDPNTRKSTTGYLIKLAMEYSVGILERRNQLRNHPLKLSTCPSQTLVDSWSG